VLVSNITFIAKKTSGVTNDLLVELREDNLTVLASATLPNADIDETEHTLLWNTNVWLEQGIEYLVTFNFAGTRPASGNIYLQNNYTPDGDGNAGWGGTNSCDPVP